MSRLLILILLIYYQTANAAIDEVLFFYNPHDAGGAVNCGTGDNKSLSKSSPFTLLTAKSSLNTEESKLYAKKPITNT